VKDWIKDRVKEESEGAYHDHDFKAHDEKYNDAASGRDVPEFLNEIPAYHASSCSREPPLRQDSTRVAESGGLDQW
jgi:hypothetical protein